MEAERECYRGAEDIMMVLNVVKEQCGVGRLRATKAEDRRDLVAMAGGSEQGGWWDGAEPLALGVCRAAGLLLDLSRHARGWYSQGRGHPGG